MKITIDVECTPDEARRFLGLPDVSGVQEAVMEEVKSRVQSNLRAMDPETLFKTWFPTGLKGLEELQKSFWAQMGKTQAKTQGSSGGGERGD